MLRLNTFSPTHPQTSGDSWSCRPALSLPTDLPRRGMHFQHTHESIFSSPLQGFVPGDLSPALTSDCRGTLTAAPAMLRASHPGHDPLAVCFPTGSWPPPTPLGKLWSKRVLALLLSLLRACHEHTPQENQNMRVPNSCHFIEGSWSFDFRPSKED